MRTFTKIFFCIVTSFIYSKLLNAQPTLPADTFLVPKGDHYNLFYILRQPNTIMVDLKVKKGKLDLDNPVHVFWIRYAEGGQEFELNWIRRVFVYGIYTKKISKGFYELNFVSDKNLKFTLELESDKLWRVFIKLNNGAQMILRRTYLQINGGSF